MFEANVFATPAKAEAMAASRLVTASSGPPGTCRNRAACVSSLMTAGMSDEPSVYSTRA